MAVTQLYNRTTNLNGLIEYVMNGDKTDEMKYVSGVNCLPERRRSYTRSCSRTWTRICK